jgi:protein-tyrosine kinase
MDTDAEPSIANLTGARETGRSIGAILIGAGRLEFSEAERIVRFGAERGLRFGEAGIALNLLTLMDVEYALAVQFDYPLVPRGGLGGVADEVIAAYSPHSKGVEALRALRSQLMISWIKVADRKILTIVSPERGEGRSWLAANIATLLAQTGKRTLLIDADLRNPRQHSLFNLPDAMGLTEVLTGRAVAQTVHRIHPQLRLFVLPAGTSPPNPQELLSGKVFNRMMEHCAKHFPFVLIDTPAISEAADAQIVSARAATALVVVRRNRTRHARLTAAMQNLTHAGVKVVGTVINEH